MGAVFLASPEGRRRHGPDGRVGVHHVGCRRGGEYGLGKPRCPERREVPPPAGEDAVHGGPGRHGDLELHPGYHPAWVCRSPVFPGSVLRNPGRRVRPPAGCENRIRRRPEAGLREHQRKRHLRCVPGGRSALARPDLPHHRHPDRQEQRLRREAGDDHLSPGVTLLCGFGRVLLPLQELHR